MKKSISLALAAIVVVSLFPVLHAQAMFGRSPVHGMPGGVSPEQTVLIGLGQRDISQGVGLNFTPKYLDITVGDTVVWQDIDAIERHTVSFGPLSMLKNLVGTKQFVSIPQQNGPALLAFNPKVAFPTTSPTYDGSGYANSGLLQNGKSWHLTFTQPGTYEYVCLIHGVSMNGYVVVHPAQPQSVLYHVLAGDGQQSLGDQSNGTTNDAFYPRMLTIHVGNTVQWSGGFHTISFGPAALIQRLQKSFIIPMIQQAGPPLLTLNPKIAFPSGEATYDGTGFVNSGILVLTVPPGSKAPPSYKLTFTKAGTYTYVCLLHPGMDGTITVLP